MGKKHAVLEGEDVVNVILLQEGVDYEPNPGQQVVPIPDHVSPGWKRHDDKWEGPVMVDEPAPEPVSAAELSAKQLAVNELVKVGISQASARLILGLD
jgi:hypothetical protein